MQLYTSGQSPLIDTQTHAHTQLDYIACNSMDILFYRQYAADIDTISIAISHIYFSFQLFRNLYRNPLGICEIDSMNRNMKSLLLTVITTSHHIIPLSIKIPSRLIIYFICLEIQTLPSHHIISHAVRKSRSFVEFV